MKPYNAAEFEVTIKKLMQTSGDNDFEQKLSEDKIFLKTVDQLLALKNKDLEQPDSVQPQLDTFFIDFTFPLNEETKEALNSLLDPFFTKYPKTIALVDLYEWLLEKQSNSKPFYFSYINTKLLSISRAIEVADKTLLTKYEKLNGKGLAVTLYSHNEKANALYPILGALKTVKQNIMDFVNNSASRETSQLSDDIEPNTASFPSIDEFHQFIDKQKSLLNDCIETAKNDPNVKQHSGRILQLLDKIIKKLSLNQLHISTNTEKTLKKAHRTIKRI